MGNEVSFLMSLFWKEDPAYLDDSLASLYNQTVQPDEIVLVCEGVLPQTLVDILNKWDKKFSPGVLRLIDADDAKGLPACLNKGLKAARGKYIFRFDTDDICLPDRVEKQLNYLHAHPEVVLLSALTEEYDTTMSKRLGVRKIPASYPEIVKMAKWRDPFNHTAAVYLREVAVELGGYPLVTACEDYAFFSLFLMKGYPAANLTDIVTHARAGDDFVGRRRGGKFLKGELNSHAYIHEIGFHSKAVYLFHVVSKTVIRNMPSGIISKIYKIFLRN
jgi:glycosyltransferase involved in cell wall biosynthesis